MADDKFKAGGRAERAEDAPLEHKDGGSYRGASISSSMSGNDIGDGIAERRMNLLTADRNLEVGRRPTPPPDDPRPKIKQWAKWIGACLAVVIVVVAIIIFASQGSTIS